jgi:hypothetical protein
VKIFLSIVVGTIVIYVVARLAGKGWYRSRSEETTNWLRTLEGGKVLRENGEKTKR